MGKIIFEIDDKIKRIFKSKVFSEGETIKEFLTKLIVQYCKRKRKIKGKTFTEILYEDEQGGKK